jgi:hypothetical protein
VPGRQVYVAELRPASLSPRWPPCSHWHHQLKGTLKTSRLFPGLTMDNAHISTFSSLCFFLFLFLLGWLFMAGTPNQQPKYCAVTTSSLNYSKHLHNGSGPASAERFVNAETCPLTIPFYYTEPLGTWAAQDLQKMMEKLAEILSPLPGAIKSEPRASCSPRYMLLSLAMDAVRIWSSSDF